MKTLIFSCLVIGATGYLAFTQSSTVSSWVDSVLPKAEAIAQDIQNAVVEGTVDEQKIDDSTFMNNPLVTELKQTVESLKQEIETMKDIQSEKNPHIEELVNSAPIVNTEQVDNTEPETFQESENVLMSAQDRGEALMALVYRMELRAAQ